MHSLGDFYCIYPKSTTCMYDWGIVGENFLTLHLCNHFQRPLFWVKLGVLFCFGSTVRFRPRLLFLGPLFRPFTVLFPLLANLFVKLFVKSVLPVNLCLRATYFVLFLPSGSRNFCIFLHNFSIPFSKNFHIHPKFNFSYKQFLFFIFKITNFTFYTNPPFSTYFWVFPPTGTRNFIFTFSITLL